MRKYAISIMIAALWVHAMSLLVTTEVLPALREAREARGGLRYADIPEPIAGTRTVTMTIVRESPADGEAEPVGNLEHTVRASRGALETRTRINLDVGSLAGGQSRIPTHTEFTARAVEGELVSFRMSARLRGTPQPFAQIHGQTVGDRLSLRVQAMGAEFTQVVPYDAGLVIDPGASPLLATPELRVGARWQVRSVDILQGRIVQEWANVTGRESIHWRGENIECYVVEISGDAGASTAWIDDTGRLVKQRTRLFTFVLEDETFTPDDPTDDPHRPADEALREQDGG